MPADLLPPVSISRTVSEGLFASSSPNVLNTRRRTPLKFWDQWQFSHVSAEGTRRPVARPAGIGLGEVFRTVCTSWRIPEVLLLSQPTAPGATWHSTHSRLECGEFS